MREITLRQIERLAEDDAQVGLDCLEDRLIATLGPKRVFDPASNLEDAHLVFEAQEPEECGALRGEIERAESELAAHPSPRMLLVALALVLGLEALGGISVLKVMGVELPERAIFGVGLAFAIVALTDAVAALHAPPPGVRRSRWFPVLLALYAGFGVAIAVVRADLPESPDESFLARLAQGVILVALTIGPAWIAEAILGRLRPALACLRRLALLRGRLRPLEERVKRATTAILARVREEKEWERAAERFRRQYRVAFRLRRAEISAAGKETGAIVSR